MLKIKYMDINCIQIRLFNKKLIDLNNINNVLDKKNKNHSFDIIKIRFSNTTSKRSKTSIHINDLKNILSKIFSDKIVELLNLEELNSEIIYIKFHNLPRTLDSFKSIEEFFKSYIYQNFIIEKGVIRGFENIYNENLFDKTHHYDMFLHNNNGYSSMLFELLYNEEINNNSIKLYNNFYYIKEYINCVQLKIFTDLPKFNYQNKPYEYKISTILFETFDKNEKLINRKITSKYLKELRLYKLNKIFKNE